VGTEAGVTGGHGQGRLQAPVASTRATVVMALRFTFTEPAEEYHALLRPIVAHFGALLADPDLVRCPRHATLRWAWAWA
jgi:hypothetical protein